MTTASADSPHGLTPGNGSLLADALGLAEEGWAVFPLRPMAKAPLVEGGFKAATTDLEQVREWWERWPAANIGLAPDEGTFVLDIDFRHGGGESLAQLETEHGPLPMTLTAKTGAGEHRYFATDRPVRQEGAGKALGRGLDTRVYGKGYVVAPPSVHPNGNRYSWVDPAVEIAEAPGWLLDLLAPEPKRRAAIGEGRGGRPGDDFNRRGNPRPWLEKAGWRMVRQRGDVEEWRRPGADKTEGHSATLGFAGPNVLHVFSSAPEVTPFEQGATYAPFAIVALVEHGGDFKAAARALASMGYGKRQEQREENFGREAAPYDCGESAPEEGCVGDPPTNDFFDGNGIVPARLGGYLQAQGRIRLGQDRRLWRYVDGVYRQADDWVRVRVKEMLRERFKRRHLDEVLTWLKADEPTLGDSPPEGLLNVRNGLLDWRTGKLHPHSPEVVMTVQLPVAWNPEARCPKIEQFFSEVLPEDAAAFVFEVIGYALYPRNPLHKAVLLLGPGRNGKSTLLGLVTALLGEANVSSVPLQTLAENRFAAVGLFGKLANICGDLDARAIRRTDTFKMLTGDDLVYADQKYREPFSFRSFALSLFSANEAPISSDQSDAWFARWLVIPMERRFEGRAADPKLRTRLQTPEELEGLLVMAVTGLRRLMRRGHFDEPASVTRAGATYRHRLDTVRAFIDEECVVATGMWIEKATLYRDYKRWCEEGGRFPLSGQNFNEHLGRLLGAQVKETKYQGSRRWLGIGRDGSGATRGVGGESAHPSPRPHARGEGLEKDAPCAPERPPNPALSNWSIAVEAT